MYVKTGFRILNSFRNSRLDGAIFADKHIALEASILTFHSQNNLEISDHGHFVEKSQLHSM